MRSHKMGRTTADIKTNVRAGHTRAVAVPRNAWSGFTYPEHEAVELERQRLAHARGAHRGAVEAFVKLQVYRVGEPGALAEILRGAADDLMRQAAQRGGRR